MPFGPLATAGGGGGAPDDAQYVVMVANATLAQERVLTGTASRIVVTDGGAGAAVTLSPGALVVQTDQANTWTVGSQIIQTAVDTLTAFQVFDADGGNPVLSVDTINERVGIGTDAPLVVLHVKKGASGGTPVAQAGLIFEESVSGGIQFLSPNTATQTLYFGDEDNAQVGRIRYDHVANDMTFRTLGSDKLTISNAGNILIDGLFNGATVALILKLHAAQTANAFEVQQDGGTKTVAFGALGEADFIYSAALTNTIAPAMSFSHVTSGVAAPLFGISATHELEDGGGILQTASEDATLWAVATAGSEQPLRRWTNYPNGAAGPGYGGYITADDVDNVALTIIPNGAGDVTVGLEVVYFVSVSDGNTAGGNATCLNGGNVVLYNAGGNTLTLAVAADGSATLQRTADAGAGLTYDCSLQTVWI